MLRGLPQVSLVTALNLTSQLDFANVITFPAVLNSTELASTFNFAGFALMTAAAAQMNSSTFGFDSAGVIDGTLATMSAVPTSSASTITYSRSMFLACHTNQAACYTANYAVGPNLDRILQLEQHAWEGFGILQALDGAVAKVQGGVADISGNITALSNQLAATVGLVSDPANNSSMKSRLQPMLDGVDLFKAQAFCYFAAQDFGHFKSSLCDTLGNSIQYITLALFIIGVSCFGITWCSRWSSYRVQFVPRVAPAPAFNEHAWLQDNTQGQGAGGTASGAGHDNDVVAVGIGSGGYAPGSGVQLAELDDREQPQQKQRAAPAHDDGHETASAAPPMPDEQDAKQPVPAAASGDEVSPLAQ